MVTGFCKRRIYLLNELFTTRDTLHHTTQVRRDKPFFFSLSLSLTGNNSTFNLMVRTEPEKMGDILKSISFKGECIARLLVDEIDQDQVA